MPTIGELVRDLLNWYLGERQLKKHHADTEMRWRLHLCSYFDTLPASELGTAQLRAYRAKRSEEKAAQATVNRELQVIRKAFKLAMESDPPIVTRMPKFKLPKEDNARRVFFDPVQVERIYQAAEAEGLWARLFIEMTFVLGWRPSELLRLRKQDVRLEENAVRIEKTKSKKPREVPLTEAMRMILEQLLQGREPEDPVFPVKSFRYAWKRIAKGAKIPVGREKGYILYDARRTSARLKRAAGVPESVIMEVQGWETDSVFRRYAIVNHADRLKALLQQENFMDELKREREKRQQLEMFRQQPNPQNKPH